MDCRFGRIRREPPNSAPSRAWLLAAGLLLVLPISASRSAYAADDVVLHSFAGRPDGTIATTGKLVMDPAGNLYGTTFFGGSQGCPVPNRPDSGCGIVFKLSPTRGGWDEHVLYRFKDRADGVAPYGSLTIMPDGQILGVTVAGGNQGCLPVWGRHGCGTVFALTRDRAGHWTKQTLHTFNGRDGGNPDSNLIVDTAGNVYGTTLCGGPAQPCGPSGGGAGVFYKLTPSPGGAWTESVLFEWGIKISEGGYPSGDLTVDGVGNIFGTTAGTVYEMQRLPAWSESALAKFSDLNYANGTSPVGGVIFDRGGNLYGATSGGGGQTCGISFAEGCGVVYKLSPSASRGAWTETVLYDFTGLTDGGIPAGHLAFDAAGRLYGATENGGLASCNLGAGCGVVFYLERQSSGWQERVMHRFANDATDGGMPACGLIQDSTGHWYGTTQYGGAYSPDGLGTVFRI
jgi:hypothetical protein